MRLPIHMVFVVSTYLLAFPATAQPLLSETFAAYDPTGIGKVSLAVWVDHDWRDALLKYDADHDGHIKRAECVSRFCEQVKLGLKHETPRCSGDVAMLFATLDWNHDGEFSRAEVEAQSENLFRQNDRDHDGFVTAQEMRETANGR